MFNNLKRFKDKAQEFRAAKQAAKAREYAELKAGRRLKKPKSTKKAYVPGTIGLSAVSGAIKKEHGRILSRKERKRLARDRKVQFAACYNN